MTAKELIQILSAVPADTPIMKTAGMRYYEPVPHTPPFFYGLVPVEITGFYRDIEQGETPAFYAIVL